MNLRQSTAWGQARSSGEKGQEAANPERFLTLVVEGAALAVPEINSESYKEFRANVGKLALQLPDRLPDEDKLAQIKDVLREFDSYRRAIEEEVRSRTTEWRMVASFLFAELLKSLGVELLSAKADRIVRDIGGATGAAQVQELRGKLDSFLHPAGGESAPAEASKFRTADLSTQNDNAAGLRGGGSAVEQLKGIMENGGKGYIALFRLSCLNMINQRFGAEAVQDCLMSVAAYLTQSLHSDDTIYHWSDSSLLAILQGRANDQILTAELERIVFQNRETSVNIGGRGTMLRIPITFDLTPIERLQSADDLYKITLQSGNRGAR